MSSLDHLTSRDKSGTLIQSTQPLRSWLGYAMRHTSSMRSPMMFILGALITISEPLSASA